MHVRKKCLPNGPAGFASCHFRPPSPGGRIAPTALPGGQFTMDPHPLLWQTRRHFFQTCGVGLGKIALASLLAPRATAQPPTAANPLAARPPHHAARARNVIFLFMAGGPSQLELFDYKPRLQDLNGQPIPESYLRDRRFAFMSTFTNPRMLAPRRQWARHGR